MRLGKLPSTAGWCLVAVVLASPSALGASVARPVSEAERTAVGLAVEYLDRGAIAWEEALAVDSPLAALSRSDRRAEIEVRLGPADGAEWILATPSTVAVPGTAAFLIRFPSGLEEFLELRLVEEDGEWRLQRIQSSVEPRPEPVNFEDLFEAASFTPAGALPWLWGAFAVLVAMAVRRSRGAVAGWQPVALALVVVVWSCTQEPDPYSELGEIVMASDEVRLGSLRQLRWQTAGAPGTKEAGPPSSELAEGLLLDVARMWRAEELLLKQQLNEAEAVLQLIAEESRSPRAELLRARLALLRDEAEPALKSFERASQLGGSFDTMMWETVEAHVLLGESGMARATIAYLAEAESRSAQVHYYQAYLLLADGLEEEAEKTFRTAWALEPRGREQIFADPTLAVFAARPSILPLLELASREEPHVMSEDASSKPLSLPPDAGSRLYGRLLVLRLGDAVVEVPNGAPIAPVSTGVARAGGLQREEERAALEWLRARDVATLTTESQIDRKRAELAGSALLKQEQWSELLALAERLLETTESPTTEVARLQISAVRGLERHEEAKALLVGLAKRGIVQRQRDPTILIELAELFAETEDFETAIRLLKRASALASTRALDSRIRQFAMDERLAGNYKTYSSRHFDIRYPWATGEKYAIEVAYVLEEERRRLQRWIPLTGDERLEVHLFPLADFMNTYGYSVVGLFDGKVRVPLADLQSLHPKLVAILTHELAHAMIDSASSGRAPNWFHEGLAQHVQMADQPVNYLAELRSTSRSVSLPILEPILTGFAEPQFVQMAYGQAAWLAHYLEERAGPKVFARLIGAFVRGLDTAQAVQEAVGVSYAEFEDSFWDWGTRVAPKAWPTEPRRYDKEMVLAELGGRHPSRQETGSSARKPIGRFTPTETREQQMKRWHARYAEQALPVKQYLGSVMKILGDDGSAGLKEACLGLRQSLEPVLEPRGVLNSPDPIISDSLREAFDGFQRAAVECQGGAAPLLRIRIDKAMASLQPAAKALAHFGLKP